MNRDKAIKLIKISQVTHGNTQAEEAEFIGISTGALNRFLNGQKAGGVVIEKLMAAYPKLSHADIVGKRNG